MSGSPFHVALAVGATLGEGPVWSVADQRLIFLDIDGKRLHRFDPVSGAHEHWDLAENAGCIAPARDGGYIAGMRSGIWRLDAEGRQTVKLVDNPTDPAVSRFNDGRIDPAGRYLLGTVDEKKTGGIAALYRWDRRGLATLAEGLMTANGTAFSPDGRTLYHSDTPRFVIWQCDYDVATGEATNRRVFARLDPDSDDKARPDGAAVDADGCYWSSQWEGGRLHRYDPDGRLMAAYPLPVRRPSMPCFGGLDLKTLFVTTARSPDGTGGDLYAMPVDTAGLPSTPFDPQA